MKESKRLMKVISVGGGERIVGWLRAGALVSLLVPLMTAQAGVIDEVKTVVDRIDTKVTNIKSQTNLIAPMKSTVGDIQTSLQDLPSTIQTTIGVNIDPEMKEKILGAIDTVRAILEQQASDLESFGDGSPGTGCYEFRNSMRALSRDAVDAMFLLQSVGGSSIPESPLDEIEAVHTLIDLSPCKLLLPAWLAFTKTPIEEIIEPLSKTREALSVIMPLFDTTAIDLSFPQIPELPRQLINPISCTDIENNRSQISGAALYLKTESILFRVISAKLNPVVFQGGPIAPPEMETGSQEVGIHGYATLEIKRKSNTVTKFAGMLEVFGKIFGGMADWASNKVDACDAYHNQEFIFHRQEVILTELCELSRYRSDACQELLLASP